MQDGEEGKKEEGAGVFAEKWSVVGIHIVFFRVLDTFYDNFRRQKLIFIHFYFLAIPRTPKNAIET